MGDFSSVLLREGGNLGLQQSVGWSETNDFLNPFFFFFLAETFVLFSWDMFVALSSCYLTNLI